jgi:cell filamentation protein
MSRYDAVDRYTYPGTGVLINKVGITDAQALDAFEADATAIRMFELFQDPVPGSFDVDHVKQIHRHLFQDVFDWAGEFRLVDISRGTSRFANFLLIEGYLSKCLGQLSQEKWLVGMLPHEFTSRLAFYMGEINAVHPFREGNGRVQRLFCSQLAQRAGYFVDFESISQDQMYVAMIASFNGNLKPLENLLNENTAIIEP